jgi:hypothetical protein
VHEVARVVRLEARYSYAIIDGDGPHAIEDIDGPRPRKCTSRRSPSRAGGTSRSGGAWPACSPLHTTPCREQRVARPDASNGQMAEKIRPACRGTSGAPPLSMTELDLRTQPSSSLSTSTRSLLGLLARQATPGLDPTYLETRFDRYPIVATAWQAGELRAFLLLDERQSPGARLTYLGPLFSRGGAYLDLFAWILRARLALGIDCCLGMEFESDVAESALRRLLPTSAFPTERDGHVPLGVAALAQAFAEAFPHIEGLDLARLRTAMNRPMVPGTRRTHYQMMLVPCAGLYARRRNILQELDAGMTSLRVYRAQTPVAAASR